MNNHCIYWRETGLYRFRSDWAKVFLLSEKGPSPTYPRHGVAQVATVKGEALWHDRIGYANIGGIKNLARRNAVTGWYLQASGEIGKPYEAYHMWKDQNLSLGSENVRSPAVWEMIHSDLLGKMANAPLRGSNYHITYFDEGSSYVFVATVARKSDFADVFWKFQVCYERKHDCLIKKIHCDGGGHYEALER